MPKSASEATRFTPTSPHAHSKPASSSARLAAPQPSTPPGGKYSRTTRNAPGSVSSGPPSETPAEKVARLRAAHAARRAAEISTFDRIVVRGRAIADTAHRLTVFGLVGLSVVCIGVVTYSFFDLHRHNNNKREEWLEHEFKMLNERLVEARKAELDGRATNDQIILLNRERAKIAAEEDTKNRGVLATVKGIFSTEGLKSEEEKVDESKWAGDRDTPKTSFTSPPTADADRYSDGPVMKAIQESRRQGENAMLAAEGTGGALDRLASGAADKVKQDAQSWSSWLGFGSK